MHLSGLDCILTNSSETVMFCTVWVMYFPLWFRWTNWKWQLRRSLIMYLEWLNRRYIQPTGLLPFTSNVHFILTLTSPLSSSYTTDCCFLSAEFWLKYMFYFILKFSGVCVFQIARFHSTRVELLRQALILWCEKQLETARDTTSRYSQHLQAFKELGEWPPLARHTPSHDRHTPLWPTWTQFDCLSTSH